MSRVGAGGDPLMRFAEVELERLLAGDRRAVAEHAAEVARHAHDAQHAPSLRRRTGEAVIAFGIRLAGDQLSFRERIRLVGRTS
ncbi:MAG TPA: hypothetical protein VET90_02825 [Candidatus Binatus sp.]|nr:hypothetical protein [Candidatus Binatus sp.]